VTYEGVSDLVNSPGKPALSAVGAPLHHQLYSILRSGIITGRYPKGGLLNSETELMSVYGVSRATVRRAMLSLEHEGLIERRQGLGTRITQSPLQMDLEYGPDTTGLDVLGTRVRIIEFANVIASPEILAALDLPENARIARIQRVRETMSGLPLRLLMNCIPEALSVNISRESLGSNTMLQVLSSLGYRPSSAIDLVGATLADPAIAGYLQVAAGSPLIELNRQILDENDRPIMHQLTLIPPERHRIRIEVAASELGLPYAGASGQLIPQ
jgi:GntR family transcriptional regulator